MTAGARFTADGSGGGEGGGGGGGGGDGGLSRVAVASGVVTGVVLSSGVDSSLADGWRNTKSDTEITMADNAMALATSSVRDWGDRYHGVADTGVKSSSQVFSSNASKPSCFRDWPSANK